jgi:Uma2 family endonuclease
LTLRTLRFQAKIQAVAREYRSIVVIVARKPGHFDNLAEMLNQLGVAPARIRIHPPLGKATEKDVIAIHDRTKRLYELVDGVLVEKIMSHPESALTLDLAWMLLNYLEQHPIGYLTGPDGAMRLLPGLIRIPDIAFISWDQLPKRERPTDPIAGLAPYLAIEVLSKGNTKREMDRKVREYFLSGVRLVWLVALASRTVQVFTAADQSKTLAENQVLDGGGVLPGLALPLRQVFAEVPKRPKVAEKRGKHGKPRRSNGTA